MDNVAPLRLQRARFHQHFERSLGAETRHAFGEPEFARLIHEDEIGIAASRRNF
jgi:hypothetical protein